jgi:hypothetical protein
VGPNEQETIVDLFTRLPGAISVKINPRLDNPGTTANLQCDVPGLARNQWRDRYAVLIIITVSVVTKGIRIGLAVRFRVGHVGRATQPWPGDHVACAVVYCERRVRRVGGIAPVICSYITCYSCKRSWAKGHDQCRDEYYKKC